MLAAALTACACVRRRADNAVMPSQLRWTASGPLIGPSDRDGDHFYADKDPTFVQDGGQWHLFCTVRGEKRLHQIEVI